MNNVGKGELISSQLVVLVSVKKHQNVEIPARVTAKLFSKKLQNIMMLFFLFQFCSYLIHISNPLVCIEQTHEENKTNKKLFKLRRISVCKKKRKYERSPESKICISIDGSKIETVQI